VTPTAAEIEEMSVDFDTMSAAELSAFYVKHVGYDPLTEDANLTLDEFRADCKEYALIVRCGGVDSEAYRIIEAQRRDVRPNQ
jgi:hypothetical protein